MVAYESFLKTHIKSTKSEKKGTFFLKTRKVASNIWTEASLEEGLNNARMIKCMCNVRPGDKISAEERRTGLKLKSMRDCLHDKRLQWSSRRNG